MVISPAAITFLTYLWHYLVARLLYDQLVRPLIHGHFAIALVMCGVAVAAFATGWWSARRSQDPALRRRP